MKIYLFNNQYYYEIEKLAKVFFPNTKFEEIRSEPDNDGEPYIFVGCYPSEDGVRVRVGFHIESDSDSSEKLISDGDAELTAARLLYDMLVKLTGAEQPWGLLTGVRPIKLFGKLKAQMGEDGAAEHFRSAFCVSPEKTALAVETDRIESEILRLTTPRSFSLYIAIPFCPTRCSYCSFVSASVERTKKLIEPYTQLLCRELEETAAVVSRLGLHLESVYMGGGTPTTLSAEQMTHVLGVVRSHFDLSGCREFTVEAGRPDTITEEKLAAMKAAGVDRLSINPQTLNDEVLEAIGRRHTSDDIFRSFAQARACGFNHINMDVIAGLPKDTPDSFAATIDGLTKLAPESITVHTLAMKRASHLTMGGKLLDKSEAQAAAQMVSYADAALHRCGYRPYYLYRQSRMVGNLENTGWAVPGKEGYYNVFIMEETQSIIACGAGAVTKLTQDGTSIQRIFNYKYPYEYIDGFDRMLSRKEGIEEFYDKLG